MIVINECLRGKGMSLRAQGWLRALELRWNHLSFLDVLQSLRHSLVNEFGLELLKCKGQRIVLQWVGVDAVCKWDLDLASLIWNQGLGDSIIIKSIILDFDGAGFHCVSCYTGVNYWIIPFISRCKLKNSERGTFVVRTWDCIGIINPNIVLIDTYFISFLNYIFLFNVKPVL